MGTYKVLVTKIHKNRNYTFYITYRDIVFLSDISKKLKFRKNKWNVNDKSCVNNWNSIYTFNWQGG